MQFFLDESGNFIEASDWGVVCSLALPHRELGRARRELKFRSQNWPRQNGEMKGTLLEPDQLKTIVDILHRRDALLHATAIHVGGEDFEAIELHKHDQCEGMTRHLTADHHPDLVAAVWELRRTLERMPVQLYLQCVAQTELMATAAEEAVMYFAQRRPQELGKFQWSIDAKDLQNISPQERWWRDLLGPLLESRSLHAPWRFVRDKGFDHTHFDRTYRFEKDMWFPDRPRETIEGVDIKKLYTEAISFDDSRSDILLQAADILANYLRRVLSGRIDDDLVARSLGRLQFARREEEGRGPAQCVRILGLSDRKRDANLERARVKRALDLMASTSRTMFRRRGEPPG